MKWLKQNWINISLGLAILVAATVWLSSPSPAEEATQEVATEEKMDWDKLAAGIEYAEAQREDEAADAVVEAKSEKELYDNPYIKHIRIALDGYLDGTNNGVEEGATEKTQLDGGTRCGLDTFGRASYRSDFSVAKTERNSYGGIAAYIAFTDKPDTLFWAWVYQYGSGEYTLRGFCEYAALIEQ